MKLSGSTKEGAIDSLLRAYVSRPTNRVCSEFDPDLANAYVERSLPEGARSRYEQHLCECPSCRKNVVALSRLAEPELRATSARAVSAPRRTKMFGLASWPRWAMAAAAVLVIAISLPLFLARKSDRSNPDAILAVADSPAADSTQSSSQSKEPVTAPAAKASAASSTGNGEAKPTERAVVDAVSSDAALPQQKGVVAGGDQASSGGKREAGAQQPAATEQVQVTSSTQPASDAAAGQAQPAKPSDQQGVVAERRRQNSKDAEADSKAKANESEETKKEQVSERAAIVPPPAAPAPPPDNARTDNKLKHSAGRLGLRDTSSTEAVRANERTVGGKKFSLKNGTWTDKDFDADKDLPIVTVIRDSNVYNELLGKRSGLKKFFDGFLATDRAIILYKGTVYKLIPQ